MQSFQRACRGRPVDDNATFALMPTCALTGRNRGALHNELQFYAGRKRSAAVETSVQVALESAILGVGVITVALSALAASSADRVCRARRLAVALSERFGLRRLETWRFEMDAALTPLAPQLFVAPMQCSRAPACLSGRPPGRRCIVTDFGMEFNVSRNVTRNVSKLVTDSGVEFNATSNVSKPVGKPSKKRSKKRKPKRQVITVTRQVITVERAPQAPMPRALSWGYYFEGEPWQLWTRLA